MNFATLVLALATLSCVASTRVQAQTVEPQCQAHELLRERLLSDPSVQQRIDEIERRVTMYSKSVDEPQALTEIVVPVVVHVVYYYDEHNVSGERIAQQIERLNQDFGGQNRNSMGEFSPSRRADARIKFVLAKTAPDGSVTDGIERRRSDLPYFGYTTHNGQMRRYATGGLDAWDPNYYLNIWIAPTTRLQGYAQFPGMGIDEDFGLVVHPDAVSGGSWQYSTNGSLMTHEVGHCFNLYHTWGDDGGACTGSDLCDDTPSSGDNALSAWIGVQTLPGVELLDACATALPGVMYMNFMDYATDYGAANFTPDQVTRMRSLFSTGGSLSLLGASDRGSDPSGCVTPTWVRVTNVKSTSADVSWTAIHSAIRYLVSYRKAGATTWTTVTTTDARSTLTSLAKQTTYEFYVRVETAQCTSQASRTLSFRTPRNDPSTALAVPSLVSPADNASVSSASVTIDWSDVSGASWYMVQYATDPGFAGAVNLRRNAPTSSVVLEDLLFARTYYWRVRACTPETEGTWSVARSFHTPAGTLLIPELTGPTDGAIGMRTDVDLDWTTVCATGYEVEFGTRADFMGATLLYRGSSAAAHLHFGNATTYYWRVRSVNGTLRGPWSPTWTFTTEAPTLHPPRLIVPGNNSHEVSAPIHAMWHRVANAVSFEVEYDVQQSMATARRVVTADTTMPFGDLQAGTTYYWRVRSIDPNGPSAWSPTYWFTTVDDVVVPAAPVLVAPLLGATNVDRAPTLSWQSVANAVSYDVSYSTSSVFTSATTVQSTTTSVTLDQLNASTTYYWRVRAVTSSGVTSAWSTVWNFKTGKTTRRVSVTVEGDDGRDLRNSVSAVCMPMPLMDEGTLRVIAAASGTMTIDLIDPMGRSIHASTIDVVASIPSIVHLRSEHWPVGAYTARLVLNGSPSYLRIIVGE